MSGSAGLIEIKRRIKSVTNTKKITSAMGLISTSKLRKSRGALNTEAPYSEAYRTIINQLLSDLDELPVYVSGNEGTKKAYIAITSDTGLCGGYNSNVILTMMDRIKEDKENNQVILVGEKGRGYLRRYKFNTLAEYVDIPDAPTLKESSVIARKSLELFNSGEYSEVHVVYTRFVSSVRQTVEIKKLLPLEVKPKEKDDNKLINYEVTPEADLENLVLGYINSEILNALLNSKTSEQSARMTAMDSATKNANDLVNKLNLQYNRIRQGAITQEISEIVGGAEAQR